MVTKTKTKTKALARPRAVSIKLVDVEHELDIALKRLALSISTITDEQQPEALTVVRSFGRVIEDTEAVLKQRIVEWLKTNGTQTTEKGTLQARVAGYVMEIQPTRTGMDGKKLEALLRAKGLDPSLGMDAKVSYTPNEGKLADAVRVGKLSEDELATCQYDTSYRLITPKKEA